MKHWLPIVLILSVAACAGGYRLNHFDYGRYSGSTAHAAAPDGKMALAVYGNPVNGRRDGLEQAIADSMYGTHVDHRTVFVPTSSAAPDGYRTVVVFGGGTPETVCMVDHATELSEGSPGPFTAGFCLGDEVLSYVSGRTPTVSNVNDPGLSNLIRSVGVTLFPRENPNYMSDCGGDAVICGD